MLTILLTTCVLVFVCWILVRTDWNYIVFRRPKEFPAGPFAWPLVGNLPLILSHGDLHSTLKTLVPKYGPIFSIFIGPTPAVVLNSIDSIKESSKMDEFQGKANIPTFMMRDYSNDGYTGGIAVSEGSHYEQQRKFVIKLLRQLAVTNVSMENIFTEEISNVIDHFKTLVGQPFCIKHYIGEAVENSLRKYLVEIPNEDADGVRDFKNIVLAPYNALILRPISSFFLSFFPKLTQAFPRFSGYNLFKQECIDSNITLRRMISNIQSTTRENKEIISFARKYLEQIEQTSDESSSFFGSTGMRNLVMVLKDMAAGGSESMTEQTNWCILYLLLHPNEREKIVEEIKNVIGFSQHPTKQDFNRMHYTQAAILEIMRMTSVVAYGLFNKTLTETHFRGFVIPKGTMVIQNSYAAHHEKNHWGDPENFRPERFLDDDGKFKRDENIFAFGYGRRACVGEVQGKFGIFYFVTSLLQHFDLFMDDSQPKPCLDIVEGIGLLAKPFRIVLKQRVQ